MTSPHLFKTGSLQLPLPDEIIMKNPAILRFAASSKSKPAYCKLAAPVPPTPWDPLIVGPAMKVWAFFRRFDEFIHGPEFSFDELYACLVEASDRHLDLIHDVHIALVMVILDEFDSVDKNDADRHLRNVMYLLASCREDFVMQHIRCCWMEVLVDVARCKKFREFVGRAHPGHP